MGKYSKAGRSPRGERLNNSLVRRIGTLNCGHSAHPIVYGASIPQYTPEELEEMRQKNETGISFRGKHYTGYEATQRQRRLERAIRAQMRKILIDKATGDAERLETDQIKLQLLQQDYKAFPRRRVCAHSTSGWKRWVLHGKRPRKVERSRNRIIENGQSQLVQIIP